MLKNINSPSILPKITLSLSPKDTDCVLSETSVKIFSPFPGDPIAEETDQLIRLETSFQLPTSPVPTLTSAHHAIVVDVSGSMAGKGMELARSSITSLIQLVSEYDKNSLLSLISFNDCVKTIFSFQSAVGLVGVSIERYFHQLRASGSTRIDRGVLEVLNLSLEKKENDGLIFLITDGQNDRGSLSAQHVKQQFITQRGISPKIVVLGIGEDYDASYVAELLDHTPWFHIKNRDMASLADHKDKIIHQLKGTWRSVELKIESLNQSIQIPLASVNVAEQFNIILSPHDLKESGLDETAAQFLFNASEITVGIEGDEANIQWRAVDRQQGFFSETLVDYFKSKITSLELFRLEKSNYGTFLSASDKGHAFALFRIIPWTTEQGFKKIQEESWNLSEQQAFDTQDLQLGCEPNNYLMYNELRLRLRKIIEEKESVSKANAARVVSDSSASATRAVDVYRRSRESAVVKELIDPFTLHSFFEIDEEQGTVKKAYLFLVMDNVTGGIQLHPQRYTKATIHALKENAKKNYKYTQSLLPAGPFEQGGVYAVSPCKNKTSIVLFKKDRLLTNYLKMGEDSPPFLVDVKGSNPSVDSDHNISEVDFHHVFVCPVSDRETDEQTLERAKSFMKKQVEESNSKVMFSLITYHAHTDTPFETITLKNPNNKERLLRDIESLSLLTEDEDSFPALGLARAIRLWEDLVKSTSSDIFPRTQIYLFTNEIKVPLTGQESRKAYSEQFLNNKFLFLQSKKSRSLQGFASEDELNSISHLFSEADHSNIREFHLYTVDGGHHAMLDSFSDISPDKLPHFTVFGDCKKFPYFSYPVFRFIRHLSTRLPEKLTDQSLLLKDGSNTLVSTASFFTHSSISSHFANTNDSYQQADHYDQPKEQFFRKF